MSDTDTPDDREQTTWRREHCDIDVQIVAPVWVQSWRMVPRCPHCGKRMARTSGEEMS